MIKSTWAWELTPGGKRTWKQPGGASVGWDAARCAGSVQFDALAGSPNRNGLQRASYCGGLKDWEDTHPGTAEGRRIGVLQEQELPPPAPRAVVQLQTRFPRRCSVSGKPNCPAAATHSWACLERDTNIERRAAVTAKLSSRLCRSATL